MSVSRDHRPPWTPCKCSICRADWRDVEQTYREVVVYGVGVEDVKRLQHISKVAMLD